MNSHANTVAGLIEFDTPEGVREKWKQVKESLESRAREKLTINSKTVDGRTTSAIALSTPEEKHAFIAACRAALAHWEEKASPVDSRIQNDFSEGRVYI